MIYKIRKFNEAFQVGKAGMVAKKLSSIIAKRIDDRAAFSEVEMNYSNDYGIFQGFLFKLQKHDIFVRINFLKGKSDSVYSFDVYLEDITEPSYTVDVLGMNIVEVVEAIINSFVEENVLLVNLGERGRPRKDPNDYVYIIEKWVEEDSKILDNLQRKSLTATFSKDFLTWVKDKPRYKDEIKYDMFFKTVKIFLLERGMTNKFFRKKKNGVKDRVAEDPILEAQFDEIVDSITSDEKFDFLRGAITQMVSGSLKSIFLLGSPGSGKSFETVQTLDKLNANYKVYKGGFKGTDELVRVLYNNRDGMILVFDDADSVRKNKDQNNILKAALDATAVREITWVDVKRSSNVNMSDIPPKFVFNSSIIFITNEPKVDPAIKSRSLPILIDITNSDMVDRIESKLEAYRPDVDMKTKKIALDYAREVAAGVSTLDFRSLDMILIAMQIVGESGNWKKMALLMLKS